MKYYLNKYPISKGSDKASLNVIFFPPVFGMCYPLVIFVVGHIKKWVSLPSWLLFCPFSQGGGCCQHRPATLGVYPLFGSGLLGAHSWLGILVLGWFYLSIGVSRHATMRH